MKKIIISTIYILGAFLSYGQDSIPLPNQALEVVKQFQPKVGNAKPVYLSPKTRVNESYPNLNLSYSTPPQIFTISYPDPVIKPLVFEDDGEAEDFKDGYVKLGYGNLNSPLVEAQVHYDIQDWLQTGISVRHYSARDTTEEIFRSFSKTLAEFYATYFVTDQTKVTADIHYQNDNRNYCCNGIKEFDLQPTTQLDNYGLAVRLDHNSFSVKGFSSKQNIYVNRVNSRFNEESEWHYGYSSNTNKTFGKKLIFNLPLGFDYYADEFWIDNPFQIQGRPNLFHKTDKYSIRAGAYIASNDSLFVRPHVDISYLLPWHNLEATASYEANSSVNSLHKFYREMPYFNRMTDRQPSFSEQEEIRLGLRYKTKRANIYLGGLYGNYVNQVIYNYESLGQHDFQLWDFAGFGVELNGRYDFDKVLSIETNLFYQDRRSEPNIDIISPINPLYLSALELDLRLEQLLFEKLKLYQTLRFISLREVNVRQDDLSLAIAEIEPYTDIGVGLEYLHKNSIGIFAEANNLLNMSYDHFYLDNSFKLNYHLGIKFLF